MRSLRSPSPGGVHDAGDDARYISQVYSSKSRAGGEFVRARGGSQITRKGIGVDGFCIVVPKIASAFPEEASSAVCREKLYKYSCITSRGQLPYEQALLKLPTDMYIKQE